MENKSRVVNSMKNSFFAVVSNVFVMLAGFVAQRIFLSILSLDYAGINSIFTDILTVLNLAELGIGNAVIFNLYKPIAENNTKEIHSLMAFYRKCYHIIGFSVAGVGIVIMPFLPWVVNETTAQINIYIAYLFCLAETVLSYFFSYKRSLLYAHQQNYLISIIHIGYTLLVNVLQLLFLYFTKSYYLYLAIKVFMRFAENCAISVCVDRLYGKTNYNKAQPLRSEIRRDIFIKIKALMYHKSGDFIILGTDNIIISHFLGVSMVGMYANYRLIISGVQTLFSQIISSLTPSVGNLLVTNGEEKRFEVFKKIRFINFWLVSFSGICVLVVMEAFIKIWIGDIYILPRSVLIVLVFRYYFSNSDCCHKVFKEAAGIYYEDRFMPFINAGVNVICSLVFLKYYGLAGVFLGTIAGSLTLHFYSYPKFVYSKLFGRRFGSDVLETLGYLAVFSVMVALFEICTAMVNISNLWFDLLVKFVIAAVGSNLFLIILFFKTSEFHYLWEMVIGKFCRNGKIRE